MRSAALLALCLAACQPQSRRLLVLDLALSDPIVLDATASPWHAAGYSVEYRRFYPHLTRQDLARYRTLVLLGGREPEAPSDALTVGDLAILTEWTRQGGVVVFGYAADGEGFLDRWIVVIGAILVLGTGLAYMLIAKPYDHSEGVPEGDAVEVAAQLRSLREQSPAG